MAFPSAKALKGCAPKFTEICQLASTPMQGQKRGSEVSRSKKGTPKKWPFKVKKMPRGGLWDLVWFRSSCAHIYIYITIRNSNNNKKKNNKNKNNNNNNNNNN